jgi:hopene-associated glycosyltransferase HpnB
MTASSAISLASAALPLAAWFVMLVGWGDFWKIWHNDLDRTPAGSLSDWPRVIAIVPARNEASTIRETISGLAGQDYPGEFSIIVVDDHSADSTTETARRAADDAGVSSRLIVIPAPPVPSGWTGKLWAMNTGVEAASKRAPAFIWFVDSDVALAPDILRRLVTRLANHGLSLVSVMDLLQVKTIPEKLLMPPFLYFFLMLYPPRWVSDPKARTAGAAGTCMLLRREALDRMGGLASIRGEIIDDCALARAVKCSGGRLWLGLTRTSRSIRSHATFAEIRDVIARTAFTQLNYSPLRLVGTLAGLGFTFLLPVVMTFSPDPYVRPCALAGWMLMSVSLVPTLVYYEVSALFAPLLPVAALFYAYATGVSAVRYWFGHGAEWKGRSQASALQFPGDTRKTKAARSSWRTISFTE